MDAIYGAEIAAENNTFENANISSNINASNIKNKANHSNNTNITRIEWQKYR